MEFKVTHQYGFSLRGILSWIDKPEYTKMKIKGNCIAIRKDNDESGQIVIYIDPVIGESIKPINREWLKQLIRDNYKQ